MKIPHPPLHPLHPLPSREGKLNAPLWERHPLLSPLPWRERVRVRGYFRDKII